MFLKTTKYPVHLKTGHENTLLFLIIFSPAFYCLFSLQGINKDLSDKLLSVSSEIKLKIALLTIFLFFFGTRGNGCHFHSKRKVVSVIKFHFISFEKVRKSISLNV